MPSFSFRVEDDEFDSILKARQSLERKLGRKVSWRETLIMLADLYNMDVIG